MSGTAMLQLAFGSTSVAQRPHSVHEQEFLDKARPILNQTVRDEYSIGMLWGELLQRIDQKLIIGAASVWWDQNLPGDVTSRTAKRYWRAVDQFRQKVFLVHGYLKLG
jgi:hypothetical protein